MTNNTIDWTKPIEYRSINGGVRYPATVVGRDGENYVVRIQNGNSCPQYNAYQPNGFNTSGVYHLIHNVPPPKIEKTVVLLLWKDGGTSLRRLDFDKPYPKEVVAVQHVTITEGEGL